MNKNTVIKILKEYAKKTIEKSVLEQIFMIQSDEELYALICEHKEFFSPVVRSKTNGNRKYPIYMKYKISLPTEEIEDLTDEIRKFHPLIQSNGWLILHQSEYIKYAEQIRKISDYLFTRKVNEEPISRKERSFMIFDEENHMAWVIWWEK